MTKRKFWQKFCILIKSETQNFEKTKFLEISWIAGKPQNYKILPKIIWKNYFWSKMTFLNILVGNTYKTVDPIIVLSFLTKMTKFSRPKKYARVPPCELFCTCWFLSKLNILNIFVQISDLLWIEISILVISKFLDLTIFLIFFAKYWINIDQQVRCFV